MSFGSPDFCVGASIPEPSFMAARLAVQGFEAGNPKPCDTVKSIDAEIVKWGKVIKEAASKRGSVASICFY